MTEYLLLALPSFAAGGFAFMWWVTRSANKRISDEADLLRRSVAGLRIGLKEAVENPEKFQARVARPPRAERVAAIKERRTAERAARVNG